MREGRRDELDLGTRLRQRSAQGPVVRGRVGGRIDDAAIDRVAAKRFEWKDLSGYVVAQVVGGIAVSGALLFLLKGTPAGYDDSA